jgi:hypothetical protein
MAHPDRKDVEERASKKPNHPLTVLLTVLM